MINRLQIKGLFGRFDYDLDFDRPVTILTGPNGFGKSTVLRMIEALGSGNPESFFQIPYTLVVAEFTEGELIEISKDFSSVSFNDLNIPFHEWRRKKDISKNKWQDHSRDINVKMYPLSPDRCKELNDIFGENIVELYNCFYRIKEHFGLVKRISEQRMVEIVETAPFDLQVIDSIVKYPTKMKQGIGNVSNTFSKKSSEIDSGYLQRLFNSDEITEEQYHVFLNQVNEKFDKLEGYNLMTDRQETPAFQPKHAAALKVYFDTFFEKYAVYDAFLEKLDLFDGIVNNRLMFKKLEISREKGFEIIDETTGKPLALEQLSSGEKQVIVMYYDLIFNDNENLLLLIDEPEISMHISWQSKFMEDLIRIAEHGNFRAIVATHSPDIINGLWDLQIDLGEQYQGNLYGEDEGESHGD